MVGGVGIEAQQALGNNGLHHDAVPREQVIHDAPVVDCVANGLPHQGVRKWFVSHVHALVDQQEAGHGGHGEAGLILEVLCYQRRGIPGDVDLVRLHRYFLRLRVGHLLQHDTLESHIIANHGAGGEHHLRALRPVVQHIGTAAG